MTKTNVLILMCDQMQAFRMGFIDGIAHTPNLDQLAAEGIHFPNAISVHGQCAPSRCAFMTGMSPHECNVMANVGFHGHLGHLTPQSNRTFVQDFQDAGYVTAHFGKSHLGSPLSELGFDVGECLDGNFPEGKEPENRIRRREQLAAEGKDGKAGGHYAYLQDGLDWLADYDSEDGPLFFMFDTNLPHPPFYWEEEWQQKFRPEEMTLPVSYYEETFEGKPPFLKEHAEEGPHKLLDDKQIREEMAQYYTLIAATDKACGQIIDVFKEKGIWDDTIVLFLSDHGDMMGGHRFRRKGCMPYEELYNIPCIMKLPKGMERTRSLVEEPIISTAIPGALLDLAGVKASDAFAGSPVTRAIASDAPTGDEQVFFEHYAAWWGIHPFYGVRTAGMKYVRYYGDDFEEFYDLASDPHELQNRISDSAYKEEIAKLRKAADDWWKKTGGRDAAYYESDAFKANLNY